jgi:tetratricopeptide (TPR) repeat protein
MQWTKLAVVAWIVTLGLGTATRAFAEPRDPLAKPKSEAALKHLERGDAHFRLREFADALDEYKQGARIEPAPRFLYNIAQTCRQLNDYDNAIWYFQQWLNTAKPPAEMRVQIEAVMQKLRDELARAAVNEPPTQPATDADARASAPGTKPPAAPVGAAKDAVQRAEPSPRAGGQRTSRWYHDWKGWTTTGVGVAAAAVGGGLLLNAKSLDDQADRASTERDRVVLDERSHDRRVAGLWLTGGGAALTLVGAAILAIHSDGGPVVEATEHGVTLHVSGRF